MGIIYFYRPISSKIYFSCVNCPCTFEDRVDKNILVPIILFKTKTGAFYISFNNVNKNIYNRINILGSSEIYIRHIQAFVYLLFT